MIQLTVSFESKEELLDFLGSVPAEANHVVRNVTVSDDGNTSKQSEEIYGRSPHLDALVDRSPDDEKTALLEKARSMGVKVRANASVETIQQRIADAQPQTEAEPPAAEPAQEKSETAVTPSKDEARVALAAVNKAKGMDAAIAVLKQFGADRVSELREDQYGDFIAACEAEV